VVTVARDAGGGAAERLWLCHHDWQVVAGWRRPFPEVRLVDSTRLARLKQGPERRAAQLADAGIDCVNLHRSDWNAGLVALFHRFDRLAFGWDCQLERHLAELLDLGVDAVYSDHVDRMVDALAAAYP
jgi:glycerophosphoryl diester phosphodiesterase